MQVQDLINILLRLHPKDHVEFAVPRDWEIECNDESRTELIRVTHEPATTVIHLQP